MTKLLIQHGPSKGQKIDNALIKNNAQGTIFSLRDENIDSVFNYINKNEKLNNENVFIDSQFYYSTYDKNLLKNLENVLNFPQDVSRRDVRTKSPRMDEYFDNYSNYLKGKVKNILVPGLSIEAIDWKFDYTLDIYRKFKDANEFEECYMTMVISSKMFHSKNDIDEILLDINDDTIQYEKNGIYLIINYDDTNDTNYERIDSETLSNILYFIYMLKKKNFKIMVGYTFINSVLFAMLDCEYVGSGWFNNLRKFNNSKFQSIDIFGRRKKKYFSIPLMSYINLETVRDLQNYYSVDLLKSGTECDDYAFSNIDDVSFVDLEHQFWEALNSVIKEINLAVSIEDKIKVLKSKILSAIELADEIIDSIPEYVELKNILKGNTSHLKEWLFAIDLFTKKASILIY
ncbi:MAG: hypothetical protein IJB71_02565 [Bacilli bacterium]|nr:hypothetical protein [Bacilli bacterium]